MVGGLGVRPGTDRIMVVDDPALVIEGEPLGIGRMFEIGDPFARVMDGPTNVAGQVAVDPRFTASTTPTLHLRGRHGGRRDAAVLRHARRPAADERQLRQLHEPLHGIPAGDRRRVPLRGPDRRERPDEPPGRARCSRSTALAPGTPDVVNPGEGDTVSSNPYLQFAPPAGEDEQAYECDFGNGALRGMRRGPPSASRTATTRCGVRAVDGAGNVTPEGGALVRHFTVGADTTPETPVTVDATPLAQPESWARYADGLHIATGALEAPDGSVWVTDHNAGLCRVSAPTLDGAGRIVHPELPSGTEERTCLGGLLPNAREGADAAGSPALVDPTPGKPGSGDEVVLVPTARRSRRRCGARSGTSARSASTRSTRSTARPPTPAERGPRPTAAAVGPDGNVYYVTKTPTGSSRSATRRRRPRPPASSATRPTAAAPSPSRSAAPPPARWCTSPRPPA